MTMEPPKSPNLLPHQSDWYQPAVDVAYGPQLEAFWREAAVERLASEKNGGIHLEKTRGFMEVS